MKRRLPLLLCLFAALTGTPLRQAEAAADSERLRDRLAQQASLDPPDGGVGDDSGEGVRSHPPVLPAPDRIAAIDPAIPPAALRIAPAPALGGPAGLRERAWWPPGRLCIRLRALLF